jgi:hypothetical protein
VDRLALREPAQKHGVVVGVPGVGVPRLECVERVEEERTGREEAGRPFRVPIEVAGAEARLTRLVEVRGPGELGEELPERAVGVPVRVDGHVRRPDTRSSVEPALDEREGVGTNAYATVEKQHPVSAGRLQPRSASEEPAAVGLRDHGQQQALGKRGRRHVGARVARPVVDEDDVRREPAPAHRLDEGMDRRGQVLRLVSDGHDDRERVAHGRARRPRRKPATYAACVSTSAGAVRAPTESERKRTAARAAAPTTPTP